MFHIPGMYQEIIQDQRQSCEYHAWIKQSVDGGIEDDAVIAGKMPPSSIQKHKAQGYAQSYTQLPC